MKKPKISRSDESSRIGFVGQIILPDEVMSEGYVECHAGTIARISKVPKKLPKGVEIHDLGKGYLSPGFVDIHVHGGDGHDFMDGTIEAVQGVCRAHLRHGTTTMVPTSTTGSAELIHGMLSAVGQAKQADPTNMPRIAGVHLYGPFFAPEKAGCHSREGCRPPTRPEIESYFQTGLIRVATCAAELEGAIDFYRFAKNRKCLVTCGHSNSSWNEMAAAHKVGMSHVDHFWCAMSNVASVRGRLGTPMHGSMLEFVLAHPTMSTEVIADGCHLSPELLQFAWQMKTSRMLCLVTDSNRALDMPAGKYAFGNPVDEAWFLSDGQVGRGLNGGLASALMGMDHCVRTMAKHTKVPLHEIVRMASLTPAERIGLGDSIGSIEVGKPADLLVLNRRLEVDSVLLGASNPPPLGGTSLAKPLT
jgi:N-acetylglucosamine-6-phosphate deacetylase